MAKIVATKRKSQRSAIHKSVRLDKSELKVEQYAERVGLSFSAALRYLINTHPDIVAMQQGAQQS